MITDFGKECRIIRANSGENLGDMAEKLKIPASFLSAIENGKKNVPKSLCEKIKKTYSLNEKCYKKLLEAAENSKTQVKIQMENMPSSDRDIVLSFARKFDELNSEEKEKIMKILQRGRT